MLPLRVPGLTACPFVGDDLNEGDVPVEARREALGVDILLLGNGSSCSSPTSTKDVESPTLVWCIPNHRHLSRTQSKDLCTECVTTGSGATVRETLDFGSSRKIVDRSCSCYSSHEHIKRGGVQLPGVFLHAAVTGVSEARM